MPVQPTAEQIEASEVEANAIIAKAKAKAVAAREERARIKRNAKRVVRQRAVRKAQRYSEIAQRQRDRVAQAEAEAKGREMEVLAELVTAKVVQRIAGLLPSGTETGMATTINGECKRLMDTQDAINTAYAN